MPWSNPRSRPLPRETGSAARGRTRGRPRFTRTAVTRDNRRHEIERWGDPRPPLDLLQKPFTGPELLERVANVLVGQSTDDVGSLQ